MLFFRHVCFADYIEMTYKLKCLRKTMIKFNSYGMVEKTMIKFNSYGMVENRV